MTGLDADIYFCAQDWDINAWTKAPVKIKSLGTDKMAATMTIADGGGSIERNYEFKKDNGKWVLTKVECDMSPDAASQPTE